MNAVLHLSLTSDRKGNGKRAKMGKLIYMDHAATTAVRPEVLDAMLPYFTEKFGNPSGVYTFASRNKDVINVARDIIADSLGAKPEEIYFTGGGSESDNWALKAVAEAFQDQPSPSHPHPDMSRQSPSSPDTDMCEEWHGALSWS